MVTAILLLAAQAPALAPSATAKPAAAEKMVCQLVYQARSRIPDRLCLKQSEWDKMADANRDDLGSSRNARGAGRGGTMDAKVSEELGCCERLQSAGPDVHFLTRRRHSELGDQLGRVRQARVEIQQ